MTLVVPVDPKAKLAAGDTRCPDCRADQSARVASGGFGALHDVCGKCGHDFEEWTLG